MINEQSSFIRSFLKLESASGILLIIATILALIAANTGLSTYYNLLLSTPVEIRIGDLIVDKPLLLWINDGLMAVFFFGITFSLLLLRKIPNGKIL